MTNAGLQAAIAEYGERICCISLNNGKRLFLNYPSTPPNNKSTQDCTIDIAQIQYKTFGDTDMFGFIHTDYSFGGVGVKFMIWHVTEFIEQLIVMEPEFSEYRVSPLHLS